jgi:hypothetical protein
MQQQPEYKTTFFKQMRGYQNGLEPNLDRYAQCERMAMAGVPDHIQERIINRYWSTTDNKTELFKYGSIEPGADLLRAIQMKVWYKDVQDAIDDVHEVERRAAENLRYQERRDDEERRHQESMRKTTYRIWWSAGAVIVSIIALLQSFGIIKWISGLIHALT